MLRRRIFAYFALYASGVAVGYFFFECNKAFIAISILVCLTLIVRYIDIEYIATEMIKEKILMISILLFGFMLFTFKYIQLNERICNQDGQVINIKSIASIEGKIESISEKDDGYQATISPTSITGTGKIYVTYFNELNKMNLENLLGADVKIYGELEEPSGAENPGCFNYELYLNSKGISHTFSAKRVVVKKYNNSVYWKYKKYIYRLRNNFLKIFNNQEIKGFIKGVVFGDKSEIDEETLEEFNKNSTGHILAVSGLHIGFLFSLLRLLSRRRKTKVITVSIIAALFFYGEMTGWSPSTIRAFIVLSLRLLSIYVRRPADLLSLVCTAGIMILTSNPYQLFNSGFQLSMVALFGIAFLTEPLSYFVGDYFGGLLSIQLAIMPLIGFYFSGINILSCLINIPVVFFASILVPICILAIGILAIFGHVPILAINIINLLSDIVIGINSKLSFNNFFYTSVRGINPGLLLAIYVTLFFVSSEWIRIKMLRNDKASIKRAISLMIIPIALVSFGTINRHLNDDIVFVSVGQGDCTHIRAGHNDVLIDGGGNRNYNIGKKTLKPYLLKNGTESIDVALATHLHMDHFQGLEELNEVYPVGKILIPSGGDAEFPVINCGEKIKLSDDVYIESIWPIDRKSQLMSSENENENNMVYIVYTKGIKSIIMGDLLKEDEIEMISYYRSTNKLDCDVLRVGHHGSRSSTSDELLKAVTPEIAVISVGKNNVYGHPHKETLEKFEARGIRIYRTDLNGAVGIEIRRNGPKIDTMR